MSELKQHLISEISKLNPSAREEFLSAFTEEELQSYLIRLNEVWAEFRAQFNSTPEEESISVSTTAPQETSSENVLVA